MEQSEVSSVKKHYHDKLMELGLSFLASRAFYAAIELEIFTHLKGKALTAEEVAAAIGTTPYRLEKLLDICIGLGLLTREGERYSNTPMGEECLVKGQPGYYGHMVHYVNFLFYDKTTRMEECIRNDEPVMAYEPMRRSDDEISRMSTLAMEDMSTKVGHMLTEAFDFSGARRLLDVGGGSGAIARVLAETFPNLESVILDQPRVLNMAHELWAKSPAASRIKTYVADYNTEELPTGFDILILSNIIHINGIKSCRRLMHKASEALNPGGQAVVIDFYLDDDKRGPLFANVFGLGCSILSPRGATYSRAEVEQWLEEAGFKDIQRKDLTQITGCVVGKKPGV
jgi:ubiquinone/menaquinone biosynthesis C-methylase UbiE